jgi:asparagine synthase (glutamine-hydrolysing)
MAHSVESRVPFLHTELVEFLYTLPEDYLIDDRGRSKCVFRQAMRGLVPEAILDRRDKIGFQTPQPHWLRLARDWAADTIGEASIAHATPLDPRALRRMRAGLAAGRQCQGATVWRILNLLRWAELYSVRF